MEKILSFLVGAGGSSDLMAICYSQFGLDDGGSRMLFTSSFAIAIVGSFIISLVVLAKIIVDRKNEKSIRMRDVLLGQKAYIEGYYDCRRRQINDELDIGTLEKRERAVSEREQHVSDREESCSVEVARLVAENAKIQEKDPTASNPLVESI